MDLTAEWMEFVDWVVTIFTLLFHGFVAYLVVELFREE
jgi:hypothetical protein